MTATTLTLPEFLLERIIEAETHTKMVPTLIAWRTDDGDSGTVSDLSELPLNRVYQTRAVEYGPSPVVVAVCTAHRRVVELHANHGPSDFGERVKELADSCSECGMPSEYPVRWPCPTLRALAAIWADHPDFDPAWIS